MANRSFITIGVLKEWGRLPSEFGLCDPEEDLLIMSAYISAKSDMDAYEQQKAEERAERAARSAKIGK